MTISTSVTGGAPRPANASAAAVATSTRPRRPAPMAGRADLVRIPRSALRREPPRARRRATDRDHDQEHADGDEAGHDAACPGRALDDDRRRGVEAGLDP